MSELLVRAISNTHPDPDIDRTGSYKKGDIVVVRPDDHEWGGMEGPPGFVVVKCPQLLWDGEAEDESEETGAYAKRDAWEYLFDFDVTFSNLNQDFHRVDASSRYPGALNQAGITRSMIETYLERWNATVQATAANTVTFEFYVSDAIQSVGFWDNDKASLADWTETAYNKTTGQHTINVDLTPVIDDYYAANPARPRSEWASRVMLMFNQMAIKRGATQIVADIPAEAYTMQIGRDDVRINFLKDVYNKARKVFMRRRWHFSEADVDYALSQGGTVTLTLAQLGQALLDKTQ